MPLLKLILGLFNTFWRNFSQRLTLPSSQLANLPILSMNEITAFAEELAQTNGKLAANNKQSEALRQGEQTSQFMGAGLEYEESRLYQPGDEIRRINWRLMARTGKAYTKLFQEERQENWFILVDHRASMRFGTRKRIKAAQAARVAGYYAWLAQQMSIPVAAGRLAEGLEQSPIFEGKSIYSQVMQLVCKPCPPVNQQQMKTSPTEPSLNDVLIKLTAQLSPGSRLILISDFDDVDQQTTEVLTALQARVSIEAIWIKDIAETQLPDIEGLQLQSMHNQQVYDIADESQRANYQAWSMQYQSQIQLNLNQAGVGVYSVYTDESTLEMMHSLHAENKNKLSVRGQPQNSSSDVIGHEISQAESVKHG